MFENYFGPKTLTHNVKGFLNNVKTIAEDLLSIFSATPQKNPLQMLSEHQEICTA